MAKKQYKTLADYLVIMISPLLIMLLVGSLVYFIIEIGYHGDRESRLKWVMFWFVIGSVLIGRIAIERGSAIAGFYALALAGAIGIWTNKFIGPSPLVWFLLAFIWWFTHMLTRDCTLIDDDEDASGEGLLQASGLDKATVEADAQPAGNTSKKAPAQPPLWRRILPDFSGKKSKPHAPGKWLIWFSLLALPVFGLGHAFMQDADAAGKAYGFKLLGVYVLAALCLLMNTSFLGLRRYLRQRRLRMPVTVTGLWLLMGTGIIVAILAVALIFPRPDASYDVTGMIDQVAEKVQTASERAFGKDGTEQGAGKSTGEKQDPSKSKESETESGKKAGETQKEQQPGSGEKSKGESSTGKATEKNGKNPGSDSDSKAPGKQKSESESASGGKKDDGSGSKSGGNEKGSKQPESSSKNESAKQPEKSDRQDQTAQPNPPANPTQAPQWIGTAFKLLVYLVLAGIVLFFLIRHRHAILTALRKFWSDLMSLFGRKSPTETKSVVVEEPLQPTKPFGRFRNPFSSGEAQQQSPEQLVNYTYQAMEAWAFEKGFPRTVDQTPNEFARALGESIPEVAQDAPRVTRIYSTLAYTNADAPTDTHEAVARLWDKLW